MKIATKALISVFQFKTLRYGILVFGMLHTLSSQALVKLNSLAIHDDEPFKLLYVYKDRQAAMVKVGTRIITAYADNRCSTPGELSIVQSSIFSHPEEFSSLASCVSANSVDDVVLQKDSNDNVYLAYIENGSNNQIHLQWLKNGADKFTDFPHSDQLTGRYPQHINLTINKVTNKPTIVYTAKDGNSSYINYLYVLKYDDYVEDETPGFTQYTPSQQGIDLQVHEASRPRIAYNLLGDLYIAYTQDQIGLVELDSNNVWSYINAVGNLPLGHHLDSIHSNAFDMVINGNTLYLAGLGANPKTFDDVLIYTYNTESAPSQRTFNSLTQFSTNNQWNLESLKISVDNFTKNLYISMITNQDKHSSVFNSYFSGINIQNNKYITYDFVEGYTSDSGIVMSDPVIWNDDYIFGFGLIRYDDPIDHEPVSYKMDFINKP